MASRSKKHQRQSQEEKPKESCGTEDLDAFFAPIPVPDAIVRRDLAERLPKKRRGKRRSTGLSEAAREEYQRLVQEGSVLLKKEDPEVLRGRAEAEAILQEYVSQYARYHGRYFGDWRSRLENKSIVGCCSKAAVYAAMSKCSVSAFVDAQFWFFHSRYGKTPRYQDLAGPGAIQRYKLYQEHLDRTQGNIQAPVNKAIQGSMDTRKLTKDEVFRYEFETLQRMQARWGGETKVWEMWGEPGDNEVFSDAFKQTRQVWRDMYEREFAFTARFQIKCEEPVGFVDGTIVEQQFVKRCADPRLWARRYAKTMPTRRAVLPSRARNPVYVMTGFRLDETDAEPVDHDWEEMYTEFGETQLPWADIRVICSRCGVTAKKDKISEGYRLDPEYRNHPDFQNCSKAASLLSD